MDACLSSHILITGVTSGLGRALALKYAKQGHLLSLLGRNTKSIESLKKACEQNGARVNHYISDVLDIENMANILAAIDKIQPITLAIANAGITSFVPKGNMIESLEQIHSVINTNLSATLNLVSSIINFMEERKTGQIAIICSLAAYRGLPISPAYCASKAGLKAYGDAIRPLLKQKNIYLSVVCPGFIDTPMSQQYPGKKLFMISPKKAANLIEKGLKKNQPNISFPFPLNMGSWLLGVLPSRFTDSLVMKFKMCHRSN